MIYVENAYKDLEDNCMGTCVYLRVIGKAGQRGEHRHRKIKNDKLNNDGNRRYKRCF